MPMTLAHPAAVLPLRRLGVPVSAMVIGSMVPDVPLFLGWWRGYAVTHSALGMVTVDLLATLLVLGVWFAVLRDPLVDLSPAVVRSRLARRARLTARQWLLAPAAACLGVATHLVWDAFTHAQSWGTTRLGWLQAEHYGVAGFRWAQYASGVLGLALVAWASVSHLRSLPRIRDPHPHTVHPGLLPAVVLAAGAWGLVTAVDQAPLGLHAMAFHATVNAIVAIAVGAAVACATWHVAVRAR
jgi:hypothetical protein